MYELSKPISVNVNRLSIYPDNVGEYHHIGVEFRFTVFDSNIINDSVGISLYIAELLVPENYQRDLYCALKKRFEHNIIVESINQTQTSITTNIFLNDIGYNRFITLLKLSDQFILGGIELNESGNERGSNINI